MGFTTKYDAKEDKDFEKWASLSPRQFFKKANYQQKEEMRSYLVDEWPEFKSKYPVEGKVSHKQAMEMVHFMNTNLSNEDLAMYLVDLYGVGKN